MSFKEALDEEVIGQFGRDRIAAMNLDAARLPETYKGEIKMPEPFNLEESKKTCFLNPVAGRCIVLEDEFKPLSTLIAAPRDSERRPTTGHIIAVNSADEQHWLGARIIFPIYSGTSVQFKGKPRYRVLRYDEIVAEVVIENEELELADEVS